jgi:hypothetical protein
VISKIAKKGGWKQTLASPQEREKNLFLPKKIFEMKKPFRSKHCLQTTNSMRQCLMPNPKQMLPTHTHTHTHTHEEENRRERERERERGERGRKKRQQPKTKKKPQCQEEGLQQVQQREGTKKDKEWGGEEKLTVNNTLS